MEIVLYIDDEVMRSFRPDSLGFLPRVGETVAYAGRYVAVVDVIHHPESGQVEIRCFEDSRPDDVQAEAI